MKPIGAIVLCLGLLLVVPQPSGFSGQTDTLRVQVSLVTVGVRVTDNAGREVPGLRAEDFRILEDGVRQPIAFFSSEEQPLSFGILLDRSRSMGEAEKLSRAKAAAQVLIRCGHADNELFLLPVDLGVVATGNKVEMFLSRRLVGTFEDRRFVFGVFGLVLAGSGEVRFGDFCIEPILSRSDPESPGHAGVP